MNQGKNSSWEKYLFRIGYKMYVFNRVGLSFREGNGTPLQYSCLENPMDRGAWQAAVHGVATSRIQLSNFTLTFHLHALEKEMATHSSVLAWRISGTGSLVGCCLWGRTGSDTTEVTQQQQQQQQPYIIWEGNGNPLQYSCLENSVDRGAWWAAIYAVAQSWIQLT